VSFVPATKLVKQNIQIMKTIYTPIGAWLLGAILLSAAAATAQQKAATVTKEACRVKINTNVNGRVTSLDTTFSSKAAMDEFLKHRNADLMIDVLPPAPPTPPAIPAAPRPPLPPSPPTPQDPPVRPSKPVKGPWTREIIIHEEEEAEGAHKRGGGEEETVDCFETYGREIEAQEWIIERAQQRIENLNASIEKCSRAQEEAMEKNIPPAPGTEAAVADKAENITEVVLSPNPNKGRFEVKFKAEKPEDIKLRLSDINGRELYAETLDNFSGSYTKAIDCGKDAPGAYTLEVNTNSARKVLRVLVQ
jgi:hypothetical protein